MPPRGAGRPPGSPQGSGPRPAPFAFDPSKRDVDLLDTIAEEYAEKLDVNSSQLRRYFGEVKELYRLFDALQKFEPTRSPADIYRERVEPRFKMVRSKVQYATRQGGQARIAREFADYLSLSIQRVGDHEQFVRFVQHFEAVVGFMYGKGKVRS
jgi:CRISPR type III-A-associated protein Csm2